MNLLLLRGRYPPVAVRPEQRMVYLDTLEHASLTEEMDPFLKFLYKRLDASMTDYLSALREAQPEPKKNCG